MPPIDARIALGYKPIELPDPMERAKNLLAMQQGASQNMLAQLQLRKGMQQNAVQNALAQGFQANPNDFEKAIQPAMQLPGGPAVVLPFIKDYRAGEESKLKIQESKRKAVQDAYKLAAVYGQAGNFGAAFQIVKTADPQEGERLEKHFAQLRTSGADPATAQRQTWFAFNPDVRAAATATAPESNLQSFGGTVGNVRTDRLTGQVLSSETVGPVTMTPAQIQTGEHQQELVRQGKIRLGLEAERLRREQISQPFEVSIDGKNVMVRQDKKTGRVIDSEGKDVTDKIAPKIAGSPMDPGRVAMALQASQDINAFEELVFPKDAKGNRTYDKALVTGMSIPGTSGIGGKARIAYSAIENAVAAKLRGETGAATNPGEIANTAARFRPTILDTAESAKNKIDRLREFMGMTLDQLKESNHISQTTYDRAKGSSNAPAAEGWTPEKERRYQELKVKQAK